MSTHRILIFAMALLTLAACSDDDSPTQVDREMIEGPVTDAVALTSAAATAWIVNDLATLSTHWAEGEWRSTPPRLGESSEVAVFDETAMTWTLPVASTLELESERYAIHGSAQVNYFAEGEPVADATGAAAMSVVAQLDVMPRFQAKGVQRDLDLSTTLRLGIADLTAHPLRLEGSGHTVGLHTLIGTSTEEQAQIDLEWSFVFGRAFQDCCPEGTLELEIEETLVQANFDGTPQPTRVFDGQTAPLADMELPCVQISVSQASRLRSEGRLWAAPTPERRMLDVFLPGEVARNDRPEFTHGKLILVGSLGGVDLDPVVVDISYDTTVESALNQLADQVELESRWSLDLSSNTGGSLVFDNSAQTVIPPQTRRLRLGGNLPTNSDGQGSHLLQTGALLATAVPTDDLRFLHSSAGGDDLNLGNGDVVYLQGSVGGTLLRNSSFTIGDPLDGRDGTTISELLSWMEMELVAASGGPVTITLNASGTTTVTNASGNILDDIKLNVGGRVDFNQVMVFGNSISHGETALSAADLLSTANETDTLSSLFNSSAERLNFDFSGGNSQTSVQITGTLGGEAVTPSALIVEEGVTTVDDLMDALAHAFRITSNYGLTLTNEGRIDVRGEPDTSYAIDTIGIAEDGNPFSNLGISMDFGVVSAARDPLVQVLDVYVHDPSGFLHTLHMEFTQRSGEQMWDWIATVDDGAEILMGERGWIEFNDFGQVGGFANADGQQRIAFRTTPSPHETHEFSLALDTGTPGTPTALVHLREEQPLHAIADGLAFIRSTDAANLRITLQTMSETESRLGTLAVINELPGGGTAVAPQQLRFLAEARSPVSGLLAESGTSLLGAGGNSRPIRLRARVGGVEREILRTLSMETAKVTDLLEATQSLLALPENSAYLTASGHMEVQGAVHGQVIDLLEITEAQLPNPIFESTLRFEVIEQASEGCH